MGQRIEVTTDGGAIEAYLSLPPAGRGPGLIVLQEWWGLVPQIERLCERFAAEGYVALAPDLYEGEIASERDEAARRMQELRVVDAAHILVGTVDHLLGLDAVTSQQVGLIGFCMGGALALVVANEAPDRVAATVPFYAVFWYGEPDLSKVSSPVLMHIGSKDEAVPVERVEEVADLVRAAGAPVSVVVHDGAGHAFMDDARPESHEPDVAERAWQETIGFLRDHLG